MNERGTNAGGLVDRINAMCGALDDAGITVRHLAPVTVAAALVLVDACQSTCVGDWERVEVDGEHLANIAQAIQRLATEVRDDLAHEWGTIGAAIARWQDEAYRPGVE